MIQPVQVKVVLRQRRTSMSDCFTYALIGVPNKL